MIYFNGLFSILESLYLNINVTDKLINSTIIVNPNSASYTFGKTIILNMPGINENLIEKLINNGNTIISRIPGYNSKIKIVPYLEKVLFNINWNGKTEEYISMRNIEDIDFEVNYPNLYFPKAKKYEDTLINNYPSALGILLYQVGMDNIINNKLFNNLDIIKCKKGIL